MGKIKIGIFVVLTLSLCSLSKAQEFVPLLEKVNNWQMAHPVMPPDDFCWERGTWYTGVMAAYKATGDEKFLNQALDWGRQRQWQVCFEKTTANMLFAVETWAQLSMIKHDPAMLGPSIEWFNKNVGNAPAGAKVWYMDAGESRIRYVNSLYAGAGLAMLAKATGDPRYLDYLHAFFWDVQAELFDKDAGLFYRDKRFIGQASANGRKVLWSRGNGWVFAGTARILEWLPLDNPDRPRYVELLKTMAVAVAKSQGPDGMWRPNLADPDEFSMPESSGSGFFCYGIAWGINHGVLDRATYLPVAQKGWSALTRIVTPDGRVQWGQPVGDRPRAVQQEQTHEYVTGAFLLAGSEMLKLAGPSK